MRLIRPLLWLRVLAGLLLASLAGAAESGSGDTPRNAMLGYLRACRDADFARAGAFLDHSARPDADPARLARRLEVVIDQQLWVDLDALSDEPEGNLEDGRPQLDRVGVIETPAGPVEILLKRDPTSGAGRLASQTVARIDALYDLYGMGTLGDLLPSGMFRDLGYLKL